LTNLAAYTAWRHWIAATYRKRPAAMPCAVLRSSRRLIGPTRVGHMLNHNVYERSLKVSSVYGLTLWSLGADNSGFASLLTADEYEPRTSIWEYVIGLALAAFEGAVYAFLRDTFVFRLGPLLLIHIYRRGWCSEAVQHQRSSVA
jgi:hypothetical protein